MPIYVWLFLCFSKFEVDSLKKFVCRGFLKPSVPKAHVEKAKTSTPEKEEYPSLSSIDLSGISMDCSLKSLPSKGN